MNKYEDIITLEHHISSKRTKMGMEARAAQFAPFSALTGYDDAIDNANKDRSQRFEFDEERENNINNKLNILNKYIKEKPRILLTYYNIDKYTTEYFNLKRIDNINKNLIMDNKMVINFSDIVDIKCELFESIQ